MKATETKFLDFLNGPKQFIIPIYQRTYSWTLKHGGRVDLKADECRLHLNQAK
jgi:hypothetical protein